MTPWAGNDEGRDTRQILKEAFKTMKLSDEMLEYYGDLFTKCELRRQGIVFERFLACPDYYFRMTTRLEAMGLPPEVEELPARPRRWLRIIRLRWAMRSS